MGLFSKFTGASKVSREIERSDPMAPAAPMVPESVAGIHQVEKVGGLQWQMRQLRESEERLDAKAARMGARARQHVAASLARGEGQFGSSATHRDHGDGQVFTPNFVTEYSAEEAERDRKLLDLPGGLAPEMRAYRKRGDQQAAAPETISEAERLERIRQMEIRRPVQVHIPGFVLALAGSDEKARDLINEYLERAGADLSQPHSIRAYISPGNFDQTVTYVPEGFNATSQSETKGSDEGRSGGSEGRQEDGHTEEGGPGI